MMALHACPISQIGTPRLLCVDDDDSFLRLLAIFLGRSGYVVSASSSGEDALTLFGAEAFDCVVLDYHMPGLNGLETALRMKQMRPTVPIIIFTATLPTPEGFEMCSNAVVMKNAGLEILLQTTEMLTGGASRKKVSGSALGL
jgi:CheY-like chemotaxis protein